MSAVSMRRTHLSLLIKPAAGLCNIRCTYCFYRDLSNLSNTHDTQANNKIMTRETSDKLIERALDSGASDITFAFQGGEPTLAGLDFFEHFVNSVNTRNNRTARKIKISYAVQTNGISINNDFAKFFKENRFLLGLSLDGTKDTHDFFRTDASGGGTFTKVLKCAELFDKTGVEYNILTVITAQIARHIEKIYSFYKKHNLAYLQFITCLDPFGRTKPDFYSLTPELYERFLIKLFDLWYADLSAGNYISIRFFDNLVRAAAGEPCEQCGMSADGSCPGQFVIESDGTVYPCDFYCLTEWRMGNIFDLSFEQLANSANMLRFRESSKLDSQKCAACDMFKLCRGGCRRDREVSVYNIEGQNKYCAALYNFLSHAEHKLYLIARQFGGNKH